MKSLSNMTPGELRTYRSTTPVEYDAGIVSPFAQFAGLGLVVLILLAVGAFIALHLAAAAFLFQTFWQ